jgi:iron complex outermembrane receptor protein
MNTLWKAALLAGAAWSAASGAFAQEIVTVENEASVEELVVTARRTEENLQTVPGAVSAFSERALERLQATDATGLQGAVPNLNIVQGRGSSNSTNIYIRGVGQPDALQTFDPAVGVYVDDVYYSRIRGTQFDLLDLERVEVLRGPQGTLYGKNTIGGALKFVTRKPGQQMRASAQVGAGNYDAFEAKASVSGPIDDVVAVGLSALHSSRDGFVTDPATGAKYNDKNSNAVRAALSLVPNDRFRADVAVDHAKDDAGLNVGQATSTLSTLSGTVLRVVPSPLPEYNFQTRVDPDLPNSTKLETWGVSANLAFDLTDALTLRSISAYRQLHTDDYLDFDATELELTQALVAVDQDQASQELQLAYVAGPWNVVGGLYYLKEQVGSYQVANADQLLGFLYANSGFRRVIDDDLLTVSKAAYVNASYAVTDRLRVAAGVRYTKETKDYDRTTTPFYSLFPSFSVPFPFNPPKGEWEDISPMASVDYQFNDDLMVYARASKGFKSGGFNGRANSAAEATEYDPETMVSYEAGVKSAWMDNRLRANLAVFSSKYEDFQARVAGTDTDPNTGAPIGVLSVINAGALDIWGAELELTATPISHLLLDAQIGYLNAEYGEFDDTRFTSFGGSRAFQTPAFSPEWTARFGGQYEWGLGDAGYLTAGGAARYRSDMALAVDNTPVNSDVKLEGMFTDDYWLFDARLVWESADRKLNAGLYGQNLSDEVYRTDAQEFSTFGGIRTAYYGAPRTWMVRVGWRY